MTEFFHMGGYARYVWPSYGLTFAIVILNIIWARRSLDQARAQALQAAASYAHDQTLKQSGVARRGCVSVLPCVMPMPPPITPIGNDAVSSTSISIRRTL